MCCNIFWFFRKEWSLFSEKGKYLILGKCAGWLVLISILFYKADFLTYRRRTKNKSPAEAL